MPGRAGRTFRPWTAACALALVAVVAAPTASGDRARTLRARDTALAARSRAAALQLYALDTQLARARRELVSIRARAEALRRERRSVAGRVQIARDGVALSKGRLASRLRALYVRGDVDPVAVVLGSTSLDAALNGIESLSQIASGDRSVLEQLRSAQADLLGLQRRLAERQRRLDRLVAAAAATARSLDATRRSHAAYVAQLAAERRMTRAAIARAEATAQAARDKARTIEVRVAAGPAAARAPQDAVAAAGAHTVTVTATGYALPGRTATGIPVGWGVVAVDPSVIPLGSRFSVPGYGDVVAADVGSGIRGGTIDLWFPTRAQAHAWGRRTVTIVLS